MPDWNWEQCKRNTHCRGCGKTMIPGERRLRTKKWVNRYQHTFYYCEPCGVKLGFTVVNQVVEEVFPKEVFPQMRPKRLLRPIIEKEGL